MKRSSVNPTETTASATSTNLLRQAAANDQNAWERLVRLYSRRMYRWCRRAGLQSADASNVVQESLHAVARKLGEFCHDRRKGTFRGWLRRITDNKIRDHYRRQGRSMDTAVGGTDAQHRLAHVAQVDRPSEATWDTSIGAELPPQSIQLGEAIDQVRREISERDWRFFWRVAVDGQTAAEVAREFGVSANAVRLVKMRVLRRLRRNLDG